MSCMFVYIVYSHVDTVWVSLECIILFTSGVICVSKTLMVVLYHALSQSVEAV